MLAMSSKFLESSYRYRETKALFKSGVYFRNEENLRGARDLFGDHIDREERFMTGKVFIFPEGMKIFDTNGITMTPLSNSHPLRLGTFNSDASFKYFMETKVIPDLKRGEISPGSISRAV